MDHRVARVQELVDREIHRRQSNRVLHGHPSPTLWLEPEVPVAEILAWRRHPRAGRRKGLVVYVGTPFCLPTTPDRCGFCLFPSEIYEGPEQLATYLRYLRTEGERYRGWFDADEVAAVYFGGGTANLYAPHQYRELLELVHGVFPRLAPDAEITVEGVAQLFSPAKLEAMGEAGVTRVSFGVQQLDPALLELSGRKQNVAHVLRMLERCQDLGLASNVDLIYGWPRQTVDHMVRDLETVVGLRVPHVTHYQLNVAGRTDFARHRRHELPSVPETLEMYRVARTFFEAHGYRQLTPYDWARVDRGPAGALTYEARCRQAFRRCPDGDIGGYDCWSWGFAGISGCFGFPADPGWVFMNCPRLDDYYRRLDAGQFPVARGFRYSVADLRLYALFKMLEDLAVDRRLYQELFGIDPVEEFSHIWLVLYDRGWVRLSPDSLTVVGDGGFYVPLIQSLVAADRLEEMRRARRGAPSAEPVPVTAEVAP